MTTANLPLIHNAFDHADAHDCFLTTTGAVKRFALAGRATFTTASIDSGRRFTFKLDADRKIEGLWHVRARAGETFLPIGNIRAGTWRLFFNPNHRVAVPDESVFAAMGWAVNTMNARDRMLDAGFKVWHSGRCGRCGRELTSEYRFVGFGPVCCDALGIDPAAELAQLPPNVAIEAIRAALGNGNRSLAKAAAAKCKSPIVKTYLADHLG